jgi:hypothetical protein
MTDPSPARRSPLLLVLSAGIVLTGVVWILQGIGVLTAGDSFMVGDPTWAAIGAVFVALGAVLARRAWRTRTG